MKCAPGRAGMQRHRALNQVIPSERSESRDLHFGVLRAGRLGGGFHAEAQRRAAREATCSPRAPSESCPMTLGDAAEGSRPAAAISCGGSSPRPRASA